MHAAGESKSFVLSKRVDTVAEQTEGRALEDVLAKCLDLIIGRLDQTGDGTVSQREFELALKQ